MKIEVLTISDFYRICINGCDVCPFCKSEDIDEVDDVYDAEVR